MKREPLVVNIFSKWRGVLTFLFFISVFISVGLRWLRLQDVSLFDLLVLSTQDALFYSYIYIFSFLALKVFSRSLITVIVTYGLFVVGVLLGVISTGFYLISGMTLDSNLLWFGMQRLSISFDLVLSEITIVPVILFLIFITILFSPLFRFGFIKKIRVFFQAKWLLFIPLILVLVGHATPQSDYFKSLVIEMGNDLINNPSVQIGMTYLENIHAKHIEPIKNKNKVTLKMSKLKKVSNKGEKNVVVIILESTRARSVTPYNINIKTTPFLDSLSRDSLLVNEAYSIIPHTSKAVFSILCGLTPRISSEIVEATKNKVLVPCLPSLLKDIGYKSVFFQAATKNFEKRDQLVENMGFDEFIPNESMNSKGYQVMNSFGFEDDIMLPSSQEWLKKNSSKPFIATYLTVAPHFHIKPNRRYGWTKYVQNEKKNDYLNALNYLDNFVKNLINQYKKSGIYKNTIFVIVGDHGEAFKDEHNLWGHGNILYEEGIRVPLLIHNWNYKFSNNRIDYPVHLSDILPTVVDLLGYKVTESSYLGRSLVSSNKTSRELLFNCIIPRKCAGSLVDKKKYIHYFGRRKDELFDLNKDPLEKRNLISSGMNKYSKKRLNSLLEWRNKYLQDDPYHQIDIERKWPIKFVLTNKRIGYKKKGIAFEKIFDLPEGERESIYLLKLDISGMTPAKHIDIRNKVYKSTLTVNGVSLAVLNYDISGDKLSNRINHIEIPIKGDLLKHKGNQLLISPGIYRKRVNYDDFDIHSIKIISPFQSSLINKKNHMGDQNKFFKKSFKWPKDISLTKLKLSIDMSSAVPRGHEDFIKGFYKDDLLINGHRVSILNKSIYGIKDSSKIETIDVLVEPSFLKTGTNIIAIRAGFKPKVEKYDKFIIHKAELFK